MVYILTVSIQSGGVVMLKCSNCGHEQASGKFCGKCGQPLSQPTNQNTEETAATTASAAQQNHVNVAEQNAQQPQQPQQPQQQAQQQQVNPTVEKMKATSRSYWAYFLRYIKRPSQAFETGATEFVSAVISCVLYVVLLALSVYLLISQNTYGMFEVPFFRVFFGMGLFLVVFMAVTLLVMFLTNKLFGPGASFKDVVAQYGGHLTPALLIAALTLILVILNSYTFAALLFFVSIAFMLSVIPIYVVSSFLTRSSHTIDPFYGYVLYLVVIGIAFVIILSIFGDSMMYDLMDFDFDMGPSMYNGF